MRKGWILAVLIIIGGLLLGNYFWSNHREIRQEEAFVHYERNRSVHVENQARDLHLLVATTIFYSNEHTYTVEPLRNFSSQVRSILQSNLDQGVRLVSVSYEIVPTEETFILIENINLAINSFLQKEWMIESEEGIVFLSEFTGNPENSIFHSVSYPLSVEDIKEDNLDVLWRLEGNPMIRREIEALREAD